MNSNDYKYHARQLKKDAYRIMQAKQPEYTNNNTDVLHNFKSTANRLGTDPMMVWSVFFDKHIQAIQSHAANPDMEQAEPIESRYADAMNYLQLGYALMKERENVKIEFIGRAHDPQFGDYTVVPGNAGTEGAYLRKNYPKVYNKYKKYFTDESQRGESAGSSSK